MSQLVEIASFALMIAGLLFFLSGSVGLLRFPDIFCRLHAVTKADSLGLGLVAAGLAIRAGDARTAMLLLLTWLLVMASGAVSCQLFARYSRHDHAHPKVRNRNSDE